MEAPIILTFTVGQFIGLLIFFTAVALVVMIAFMIFVTTHNNQKDELYRICNELDEIGSKLGNSANAICSRINNVERAIRDSCVKKVKDTTKDDPVPQ